MADTLLDLELESKRLFAKEHHEWPEVVKRLDEQCAKAATPDALRAWTLRQTWLAEIWSPDPHVEELLSAGALRTSAEAAPNVLLVLAADL